MQDVESSHKFHRFLTRTRLAPLAVFSLTLTDGPSLFEGGVRLGPLIWARSLEAIAFIAAGSMLADSSSCMHADSDQRIQLRTPIDQSSKTDSSTMSYTLFSTSGRSDHTNSAVDFTQHTLGQCRVPISPIANGCSVFPQNDLRLPHFVAP